MAGPKMVYETAPMASSSAVVKIQWLIVMRKSCHYGPSILRESVT